MQKRYIVLCAVLLLAGCDQLSPQQVDGKKLLSGLDGPKVPTVQDALTETAKNAEANGDFKQAAGIYKQILDKSPADTSVALALAEAYRRNGDYEHAMPIYDGLLAQDPKNIGAKEGKGLALLAKGDFDTPGTLLGDVLKVDGTRWKSLNGLGILFTTRNLQPEAQQYFRAALKYNPNSASVMNNIALSEALQSKFDDSIAMLQQASANTPAGSQQRKRIDLNTALVYATAGKLDEARALTEHYYSGAALDNNLGLYAHLAKDDQMAKSYLNMALTESKVYYDKAWTNLQNLGGETSASIPVSTNPPQGSEAQPSAGGAANKSKEPEKSKTVTVPQ